MKKTFLFVVFICLANISLAQTKSLPYYTGFDSAGELAGWQEYRTGFTSSFSWETNGLISHEYNVGGNPTDTVIDWFVSPALDFSEQGKMKFEIRIDGFSNPSDYNCQIWFGTDNQDPLIGNFTMVENISNILPSSQWIDTTINIPFTADSGFIAIRYQSIGAEWVAYSLDSFSITADPQVIDNIIEIKETKHHVFPNPMVTSATIKFDSEIKNGTVDLTNLNGQKVKTFSAVNGREFSFKREDLPTGIYMLNISDENLIKTIKKILIRDY